MRFEQLNCLVAVADKGAINTAAEQLFITPQAVSANIKQLEQEMGRTLFVRQKTGISLTEEGKEAVEFARKVLSEKEMLFQKWNREDGTYTVQEIDICSNSSVTNIVLPDIIKRSDAGQQKVSIKISLLENTKEILESVQTGICDLGLLTYNKDEFLKSFSAYQDELQLDILAQDKIIAVMDKHFFQGDDLIIHIEEMARHPISMYNIVPVNNMKADAKILNVVWSNDADFHRSMMEKAGAIVLMPSLARQYFFFAKKYIALPAEKIDVPLIHAAIYRKDADSKIQELALKIRMEMHMHMQ